MHSNGFSQPPPSMKSSVNQHNDVVNIFMSCNDAFLFGCCSTLTAIRKQTSHRIHLYFAGDVKDREKIQSLVDIFTPLENEISAFASILSSLKRPANISVEAIYRCVVPFIIHEKRLLWLDSDTIPLMDISDLYFSDLNEKSIGVARREKIETILGKKVNNYFNSGVILFDLETIQSKYTLEDMLALITTHHNELRWYDQDVLNYFFADDKALLSPLYNYQIFNRIVDRKSTNVVTGATILHFWGRVKPWQLKYFSFINKGFFWKFGREVTGMKKYLAINILNYLLWPVYALKRVILGVGAE